MQSHSGGLGVRTPTQELWEDTGQLTTFAFSFFLLTMGSFCLTFLNLFFISCFSNKEMSAVETIRSFEIKVFLSL